MMYPKTIFAGANVKGIVKWFSKEKGFGFIYSEEIQKDVFVHGTDTEEQLLDGQHVEFNMEPGAKGPKAKNVKVVPNI